MIALALALILPIAHLKLALTLPTVPYGPKTALQRPTPAASMSPKEARYRARPTDVSAAKLSARPKGPYDGVVVIFHGAGGPDRETDDLKAAVLAADRRCNVNRLVEVFDWRQWLGGSDRAAFEGQAIGEAVGKQLAADEPPLRSLHVIGTSVGAFAADACVSSFVSEHHDRPRCRVRLSLTDPFTSRGDLTEGWGLRNFGRTADFAEQIFTTDGIVPTTNDPLPLCYCLDVTRVAERKTFRRPWTGNLIKDLGAWVLLGHQWPMGYLARRFETVVDADGLIVVPHHDDLPRGTIRRVK